MKRVYSAPSLFSGLLPCTSKRILTTALVLAVALLAAARTEAASPVIFKVPVDFTDTFSDCGFTIIDHNQGSFTVHVFFDKNGDPKIEIDSFALKETFTNPANGMSFTTTDAGPSITTFHKDGSLTVADIGLFSHVVLKGQGVVAAQVGKIVAAFDADGNLVAITFEAGKHDELLTAICAALA
jgi:hypothetical protein